MKRKKKVRSGIINNVIAVSDLHCGCQLGLCPPEPQSRDSGGAYTPSDLQMKVWQWWRNFWDEWVPMVTRGEPYAIVNNAESIDGVHHGSKTQITQNLTVQAEIAEKALLPEIQKKKCIAYYHIRGTEVHSGKSGEEEEKLAKTMGAVPDRHGRYSRYELWMQIGERLAHIMHHIGTSSSTAYETTALSREFAVACEEAGRWGLQAPNVIVRSHRHRHAEIRVPTKDGYGICVTTPGWQLKTPFVYRTLGGRQTQPQFGGVLIRYGDEELYTRSKVWNIEREPIEVVKL